MPRKAPARETDTAREAIAYRVPMCVAAVRCYPANPEPSAYPLCPQCSLPMEREYQSYCDHCGQALDWKRFSKAIIILVQPSREVH